MGLPKEAENLVILTFALQTNRSFFLHNAPDEPSLTSINDRCELREQRLPDPARWEVALQRAGSIFGIPISPLRNASNVAALAGAVRQKMNSLRTPCQSY